MGEKGATVLEWVKPWDTGAGTNPLCSRRDDTGQDGGMRAGGWRNRWQKVGTEYVRVCSAGAGLMRWCGGGGH